MKEAYGVELALAEGFAPARQSEQTMKTMRGVMEKMDVWELAGESLSYIDESLHSSPRYKVFDPPPHLGTHPPSLLIRSIGAREGASPFPSFLGLPATLGCQLIR